MWARNRRQSKISPLCEPEPEPEPDYGTHLWKLNIFSVQGRLLRADMIKCWKIFHGKSTIRPTDLWVLHSTSRTCGHMFRIQHRRCQVDARARFCSIWIMRDWNILPASTVSCKTLEGSKTSGHSVGAKNSSHFTAYWNETSLRERGAMGRSWNPRVNSQSWPES